jgi:EAL domain-containing protein (putative c-di-GMP-specific phosphodiesterase class I)
VLGRSVFSGIEPYMAEAAAGRVVRFERAHTGPDGTPRRFAVQFLPQTGGDGNYAGFHIVMTRIADHEDETVRLPAAPAAANEWQEAGKRVLAAINGNEFSLFCQRIAPVNPGDTGTGHHEILIRLLEEESGLVPPGVFFSLAEEHGLLPQLDQWVLAHVLDWMATPAGAASVRAGEMCFVNVAAATLADPGFPEFVEFQLRRTGVAGTAVCFEISEPDLLLHQAEAVTFAHLIRECGCRIALSGFGRNRLAMDVLKLVPVDFLKIDSGIVRQLAAYPVQLGKAVAICKLAKAIGVRTIAEMVEDPATLALLREAGVDYAQGFGIALPERLGDMQAVSPAPAAPSLRYAA